MDNPADGGVLVCDVVWTKKVASEDWLIPCARVHPLLQNMSVQYAESEADEEVPNQGSCPA
jgi:hypothetical protein